MNKWPHDSAFADFCAGGEAEARKLEAENNARMNACPQFEKCSAPKCPLDLFIDERVSFPDEPKCLANKRTRIKIAEQHPGLPDHGLTSLEAAAIRRVYPSLNDYLARYFPNLQYSRKNKTQAEGFSKA